MKSDKSLLIGLLVGVSAGAFLGILAAPKLASIKRKKISGKKEDFAGQLKEKFDELFVNIMEKFKNVQKETSEFIAQEKQKIDELKKAVKTAKSWNNRVLFDRTASQPDMPMSAIASGCIDFVLSPEDIAKEIIRIAHADKKEH